MVVLVVEDNDDSRAQAAKPDDKILKYYLPGSTKSS